MRDSSSEEESGKFKQTRVIGGRRDRCSGDFDCAVNGVDIVFDQADG
jgi:hypothetical protein